MIYFYFAELLFEWQDAELDYFLSFLSSQDQAKYMKFVRWQDRQLGISGRLLLYEALTNLQIDATSRNIIYTNYNKPYYHKGPHFNISHSGNIVICAVSNDSEIGVDIEQINPIDFDHFAKCFTEGEWSYIYESKEISLQRFYQIWTRKEALIKADGQGLSIPLAYINTLEAKTQLNNRIWHLSDISLSNQYSCTIATLQDPTLQIQKSNLMDLVKKQ